MAAMTQEQVKAAGLQGWAIKRTIKATLWVQGQATAVTVLGDRQGGALVAREDGKIAHVPVPAERLTILDADALHLDGVCADLEAVAAGRFFNPRTSMNHRLNWNAGRR